MSYVPAKHGRAEYGSWMQVSDAMSLSGITEGSDSLALSAQKFAQLVYQINPVGITLSGDVEIGAVEIKDPTTNTRATVGSNGLYIDVRNIQSGSNIIGKVGIDQTTPGTTNKISLGTDIVTVKTDQTTHGTTDKVAADMYIGGVALANNNPEPVQTPGFTSSASFTRPNDSAPYTALDVVGPGVTANLQFNNIGNISAGHFIITGVQFEIDVAAVPAGMDSFRLHLYDAAPTALADNAAFNIIVADREKYLGFITINTPIDMGDTLFVNVDQLNFKRKLAAASTTLYGVMQTVAAYAPTALVVKKVTIHGVQC